ncbi:MAG TPA: hypothetical protein VFW28_14965 [Micropepsaceae bacterium]|nr:hypothetical protein [Micropepsaceae bacterium]
MTQGVVRILYGLAGAAISLTVAVAAEHAAPPDFAPNPGVSWLADPGGFKPPAGGAGPVQDDPTHPTITNDDYRLTGKQPTFPVADLSNPILQPWARDVLRRHNEQIFAGKSGLGPRQSCWPVGTPALLIVGVFRPIYIIQSKREVLMTWQLDHQYRHVYLDVPHSRTVKPSWFGESVGHYEGDALVVDTIGISAKAVMDDYLTPHTDKLHVVERYRMTNNGRDMEVQLQVEDPGAFTMPWNAVQYFHRLEPGISENTLAVQNDPTTGRSVAGPLQEESCAENAKPLFTDQELPIPQANTPDF